MQIVFGSSSKHLAKNIAKFGGCKVLATEISKFSDGEFKIEIHGDLEKKVAIIQSTCDPVNDNIIELLLLIDTVKRAGAEEIIAVVPYLGYSRSDRIINKDGIHSPLSASVVASLLKSAGVSKLITLDLHSKHIENFAKYSLVNVELASIFSDYFHKMDVDQNEYVFIAPDEGSVHRTLNLSLLFNKKDIITMNKTRVCNQDGTIKCIVENNWLSNSSYYQHKHCIIVDDIIDSAETLCKTAQILNDSGALKVTACASHAVLSGVSIERLMNSPIDKIIVSNSIYHSSLPSKFIVIDISKNLAKLLSNQI